MRQLGSKQTFQDQERPFARWLFLRMKNCPLLSNRWKQFQRLKTNLHVLRNRLCSLDDAIYFSGYGRHELQTVKKLLYLLQISDIDQVALSNSAFAHAKERSKERSGSA